MIRASQSEPQGGLGFRYIALAVLVALAGCSQPDEAATEQAAAPAETAPQPAAGSDEVTSIDADGNVAPFGMASRQPVEVPPLESAQAVAATGGAEGVAADSSTFRVQCAGCHGVDAGGFGGLGVSLVKSELVANSSASELIEFLKVGRMPDSPDSITGVPMPGFAWMPDEQLREVVLYIKQL
jgi:mono/diheme cytochrome c family protein